MRLGIAYYQYAHEFDNRVQYLDSALSFVQEGIAQGYGTSGAYGTLGMVLNDQKRLQEAADALRESLRLDPDNLESMVLLGDTYRILDQPAEAVAILQKALAKKSGDPHIMERLGVALVAADRPDEALQIMSRSLTVDGFNPATYNNLGTLFATRYHLADSAMAYFTDVLTMDPDFSKIHLNIGNTLAMLGNYREALASYQRQVNTGNDVVGALVNMSAVYRLQGNVKAAEQALRDAQAPSLRRPR